MSKAGSPRTNTLAGSNSSPTCLKRQQRRFNASTCAIKFKSEARSMVRPIWRIDEAQLHIQFRQVLERDGVAHRGDARAEAVGGGTDAGNSHLFGDTQYGKGLPYRSGDFH